MTATAPLCESQIRAQRRVYEMYWQQSSPGLPMPESAYPPEVRMDHLGRESGPATRTHTKLSEAKHRNDVAEPIEKPSVVSSTTSALAYTDKAGQSGTTDRIAASTYRFPPVTTDQRTALGNGYRDLTGRNVWPGVDRYLMLVYRLHGEDTLPLLADLLADDSNLNDLLRRARDHRPRVDSPPEPSPSPSDEASELDSLDW